MIITTATAATTTPTLILNIFEGGIFLVGLLIILLSLKEILDSDKKFFSFTPKINTLIFPSASICSFHNCFQTIIKLTVLASLTLIVLSSFGSGEVTVSISSDNDIYNLWHTVKFTATVNVTDETTCILEQTTLEIYDGHSIVCYLPVEEGNYGNSYTGNNCNLSVIVTETNYDNCHAYGDYDNLYKYLINWTTPSNWSVGNYTARFNASNYDKTNSSETTFELTYAKFDYNTDYNIDFLDFVRFARTYGATSCFDPIYNLTSDIDDDCDVDFVDFVNFTRRYETRYGPYT